jgi:hypothetical protein
MSGVRTSAAVVVAIAAFVLYRATLLPSFDFGDTASFQATVGSPIISSRDGYPLYFAIGSLFVHASSAEPARALNLASAVEASIACGIVVLVAAELSGSVVAGVAAALLFAVSYTFWSQAIIAEVYALHILFVSLTLLLLLRWAAQPTTLRLAAFFSAYALGFGNHLSMILLAPAYACFLLTAAPGGWRSLLRPRVIVLAIVIAGLGALQYAPSLRALWLTSQPPRGLAEGFQHFWFDVTKSDWRDTMVMSVPRSMLGDRLGMYSFDLRQQFGIPGALVAMLGIVHLAWIDGRRTMLLLLTYGVNFAFAAGYNVGDAHVFFLPSHLIVALFTACGIAMAGRAARAARPACAVLLMVYVAGRAYHDYPALDRSGDRRPAELLGALTDGLDDQHAILLADLNWQLQNGLAYFAKVTRPAVAYARLPDVLLYAPALAADNHAIGRNVALTERARLTLTAAYGPLLPAVADRRVAVPALADTVRDLPAGTRYAMCVLRPSRDIALNADDLAETIRLLTGGRPLSLLAESEYAAVAGRIGETPGYIAAATRPFRRTVDVGGTPVEIRMDSWLGADTIRRMGFGHVIAARHHTLIVERGVSFVAFDEDGRPLRTAYAAGIFAPQARYLVVGGS